MAGVAPTASVHVVVMRGDDVEVHRIDGDAKYTMDAGWWNGHSFVSFDEVRDPQQAGMLGYRRATRIVYEFIKID